MSYDLCEELIVEIFTRLPAKSLLRFQSVSKSLRACIGSPGFIRMHTLRSPEKVMILQRAHFERKPGDRGMITLRSGDQLSNDPYVDVPAAEYPFVSLVIVGSCDGIICVYEHRKGISLWNPSIRRKVTRPSWIHVGHQWDPLGFGFDPVVGDYKILIRSKSRVKPVIRAEGDAESTFVYTMKTDTWREIGSPATTYDSRSSQCIFSGALHWVVRRYLTDSDIDCNYHCYILTFDLSSEVFSTIELPLPSWKTKHVTVIKGSLAVISLKHDDIWIWMRNDTAASWSVAFKLNKREFEGKHRVFQLTTNDDLLFCHPFYSGIIVYNPKTKERSEFVGSSASSLVGVTWPSHVSLLTLCVESLGLLDMGTSCAQSTSLL